MKRKSILIVFSVVISILFVLDRPVLAAPYYTGKSLTIVVGSAPGGGYNNMARLIGRHLSKYIPGKPHIVIQNMPGASGVIAANYLYNIVKPDGLTIGAIQGSNVLGNAVKAPGINFDVMKFRWIGSSAIEPTVLTIRSDLPYKGFDDLMRTKNPIYLGVSGGAAGVSVQFMSILKSFVDIPHVNLVAYPSNAEVFLAIERKELDGLAASYFSLKHLVTRGVVRVGLRGRVPVDEIKNVPVDEDYTKNATGKALMAIRSSSDLMGRPYLAPPGTPAEMLGILREAFFKVTHDPTVEEEAKKSLMQISHVSGEECSKNITFILGQQKNILEELSKYVK